MGFKRKIKMDDTTWFILVLGLFLIVWMFNACVSTEIRKDVDQVHLRDKHTTVN